mgnify:FL=1
MAKGFTFADKMNVSKRIRLKKTFTPFQYFVCLALLCVNFISHAATDSIIIYIRDDVYEDYLHFTSNKDVLTITEFTGKKVRRDVVDMIIAQQALRLGGFNYTFKYAPGKVNFRNTKMIQTGDSLISFDSYWLKDATAIKENVYISAPVIRQGEYVAGIYTSPENSKTLALKTFSDLQELTAISTSKWRTDWQTLSELPLKNLVDEQEWLSMARLVSQQWVDFLLMPFHSSTNQLFIMDKIILIPVEGVGIELFDSRHFVISKKHPKGAEAITAINIGIKKLRENKAIVKAYTQAGFFIDRNKITILNKHKPNKID